MPCEELALQAAVQTASPPPPQFDLPEGVPPLTWLYLYIAGACNLACRHCWIAPAFDRDGSSGRFIRLEYVEKAVREARRLGLRGVKLTGGEPLLHPRFRDLVALLADAGLDITIETNGTLVDDGLAAFLKESGQLSFISVSVDGAAAEVHEALRVVPGCFDAALDGIRALVGAGFQPQLICTLHRGNAGQMGDVVALAERLGCGSVKFNLVQSSGRGDGYFEEAGLGVAEALGMYRRLELELLPCSAIRVYFEIPVAFHSLRRLTRDPLSACHVLNILGVLSGGELALCGIGTTVPELIYGHICDDDLREVWCEAPGLTHLREVIPAELEGVCGACMHRDTCLGSCVANNYHEAGRLNAAYRFCAEAEGLGLFPASRKR
jgi:SynChlorMet cassette radical SAM/SPASM protein ScmF